MSIVSRALAAVLAVGALLVGLLASTASAGTAASTLPVVDPPSVVQLCAATSVEQVDSVLAGAAATDLVGGLAPLLTLTVPSGQGLTLKQDVTLDSVRKALDCSSTPTSTPPTSTTTAPAVKTCTDFDSRDAAQDAYDNAAAGSALRASLDPDGDRQACEANEGTSGPGSGSGSGSTSTGIDPTEDDGSTPSIDLGGQVRDVPDGSASTGGGV